MTTTILPIDEALLARSKAYCAELTRREARNFYYGLKLLPEPKRSAMYALYAYMRLVDDIADDDATRSPEQRATDLDQWQQLTHAACDGALHGELPRQHIVWPAFAVLVTTYRIPVKLFDDMIAGQRQDLEPVSVQKFDELYAYCYRVASVVGLASIYVWGFDKSPERGPVTEKLAIARGIAFQLTNVLRDLREDAARGRCYLPQEDLQRFGVTEEDLRSGRASPAFADLMRFEVARAQGYYDESAPLEQRIAADSRPTLVAMTAIYRGILKKIGQQPERVLTGRVRLSALAKLAIAWRALRSRKA